MSLNQIFMWEVSIIIPTNVKYRIISIYNKLFFKVQWNLTSHWNLRFQFSITARGAAPQGYIVRGD